jgi:hypothetical protein
LGDKQSCGDKKIRKITDKEKHMKIRDKREIRDKAG